MNKKCKENFIKTKNFYESLLAAFLLSSISGFSDSFTFVAFNKLFSSHITGNIIISIIFLFSHTPGVMIIISALPVYIVFSFIFAFFFKCFI